MLLPWWERFPGRYDQEIRSLETSGVTWRKDEQKFENGRLHIWLTVPRKGGDLSLEARYPDTFPYTQFEVFAPKLKLDLDHHIGPFENNLCLLQQGDWDPSDTIADVLESQLDKVIVTGSAGSSEGLDDLEAIQGEPISEYYTYAANTTVLIDGSWKIPTNLKKGILEIGFLPRPEMNWLGAVAEVRDDKSNIIVSLETSVARLFASRIQGRWIRSDRTIVENDPVKFMSRLIELDPTLATPRYSRIKPFNSNSPELSLDLIGIIQPEEHTRRTLSDG